jgi:hypothetical protein
LECGLSLTHPASILPLTWRSHSHSVVSKCLITGDLAGP